MSNILTDTEVELWGAFMRAHALVIKKIGRELERSHGINASMYDVLAMLARAPQTRLRMGHLADQILLSPGGLTRVVESLRKLGYVRRRVDPKDRRSVIVSLTPAGSEVRLKAQVTVRQGVANHLLRDMTPEETDTLLTAFRRVLSGRSAAGGGERADGSPAEAVAAAARA
jgi:DNA-binding MarR family transcriptional regulator